MAEASGEIPTGQSNRPSAPNPQETQSTQTNREGEKPADGAIIDMVQTPDGKWVARDPQDPKFFYQPEAERSTGSTSTDTKPQTAPKPETKKPTREDELRYLQADGAELAALVYTPEGQRQIAEARTRLTQVVETTSGKPRLEHAHGFNRIFTSRAINQLNERIMQTWRQNIDKRVEELLRGERMTNSEDGAYLTAVLKHGPIPQETTALLAQFQQQRREIGRALLYQSSDNLPVGRRLLLANEGRLRLFGISTTQAQQSFAEGWDMIRIINTSSEVEAIRQAGFAEIKQIANATIVGENHRRTLVDAQNESEFQSVLQQSDIIIIEGEAASSQHLPHSHKKPFMVEAEEYARQQGKELHALDQELGIRTNLQEEYKQIVEAGLDLTAEEYVYAFSISSFFHRCHEGSESPAEVAESLTRGLSTFLPSRGQITEIVHEATAHYLASVNNPLNEKQVTSARGAFLQIDLISRDRRYQQRVAELIKANPNKKIAVIVGKAHLNPIVKRITEGEITTPDHKMGFVNLLRTSRNRLRGISPAPGHNK